MTSDRDIFQELLSVVDVSRETLDKLRIYQNLLEKWNKRINLVGPSTIESSMQRHFIDSAQLWKIKQPKRNWIDLGTGAGFPGLVVAIIAAEINPEVSFDLVDSDTRKCAFLRNVSRETGVKVNIHTCRIEKLSNLKFEVLSARALAPLSKLLNFAENILSQDGECLFLKGRDCDREIEDALRNWDFEIEKIPSVAQQGSSILRIGNLKRVKAG